MTKTYEFVFDRVSPDGSVMVAPRFGWDRDVLELPTRKQGRPVARDQSPVLPVELFAIEALHLAVEVVDHCILVLLLAT